MKTNNKKRLSNGLRQSKLFTKTLKNAPSDEVSKNAQLLIRAGYVYKEMAGVYSFLPLGLRVIEKIKNIIREELNTVGANELKMTALQKKEVWEPSNRWDDEVVDDWFKTKLKNGTKLGLAFTHEEALTNIMTNFVSSYRDLPIYAYQFQTKFRNELRAKSGIMRGREFVMKDLYDFSLDKEQHDDFYEKMKIVYKHIFDRVGLGSQTYLTISSGGSFSKYSYEFQTVTDAGEDIILVNKEKNISINKDDFNNEVLADFGVDKDTIFKEYKSVEVGDIYNLGDKFSKALNLTYKNEKGEEQLVYMGSYGIGIPRLMGVIVEVFSDNKGIIWPESVAPFQIHLINIGEDKKAEEIYEKLLEKGIEVLWDDRDKRPGEKLADADLIGIPHRIVVSARSWENGGIEYKKRDEEESRILSIEELIEFFKK